MIVIIEGCLCFVVVIGEVEVDVFEIVCEEVECELIFNILLNLKNLIDLGENLKLEEKVGEK